MTWPDYDDIASNVFPKCDYLDFESAVIAQNDEFKGISPSRLGQETQYFASALTAKSV